MMGTFFSPLIVLYSLFTFFYATYADCVYSMHNNKTSPPGHERLKQLIGRRYVAEAGSYTFYIGICTPALDQVTGKLMQYSGVVQKGKDKSFSIGKFTEAQIISGANWVFLEYRGGDTYNNHCQKEKRKASIMFVCDLNVKDPVIRVLEENTDKVKDCYYLFEMTHYSICNQTAPPQKLSVGSIIVISFCVLVAFYIVVGFIVQRVRGAKGMEQIPNYGLWQECGNLVADGCDFVFRSRPKATNHFYPPMDGRQPRQTLQPDDRHLIDEEDHDDHMLPM